MFNLDSYRSYLSIQGENLAQIRKNQSELIFNQSFTSDPTYKKVYILTKNGWKFEDAKYQEHTAKSILRDEVDYYLQFRPKIHYPIGSYVIIPDDTDFNINLSKEELQNPFLQPVSNRTQWWMIVGRSDNYDFIKYNILKCNWNFQWVWNGKIQNSFGCIRNMQSYTSGRWTDEISSTLDNLTGAWLPDIYYTYGDNYESLGLDDNRTIMHEQRFMLTNNIIDPKVYQVTKIVDLSPQGIIKLSVKQDEFNEKRDNKYLKICDYYRDDGEPKIKEQLFNMPVFEEKLGIIHRLYLNENNELTYANYTTHSVENIRIGELSYFGIDNIAENSDIEWTLSLSDSEQFTESEIKYYERLVTLSRLDSVNVSIKLSKAKSLSGKCFLLTATDLSKHSSTSIKLEVENYET